MSSLYQNQYYDQKVGSINMGCIHSRNQGHHHDPYCCRASSKYPSTSLYSARHAAYDDGRSKLQSRYSRNGDDYHSLEQVKMLLPCSYLISN